MNKTITENNYLEENSLEGITVEDSDLKEIFEESSIEDISFKTNSLQDNSLNDNSLNDNSSRDNSLNNNLLQEKSLENEIPLNECLICLDNIDYHNNSIKYINMNLTDMFINKCSCKYYIHESCLEQWIITKPTCPLCNTKLVYNRNINNRNRNNRIITIYNNTLSENNIDIPNENDIGINFSIDNENTEIEDDTIIIYRRYYSNEYFLFIFTFYVLFSIITVVLSFTVFT